MRRVSALCTVELRTQWRYGIPVVVCLLGAVWAALLAVVQAPQVAPYLLFVETITGATMVAGALASMNSTTGATAALRVTPARPVDLVLARTSTLTAWTVLSAVPIVALHSGAARIPAALTATALAAALLLALAIAVAARRTTFLGFLSVAPWPMLPLIAIPLAVGAELLDGGAWYAVPTTGALALLRGDAPYPEWLLLGYLAAWTAAAILLAVRATAAPPPATATATSHRRPLAGRWVRLRADARNVSRDAMLAPIVASPLLLGLALRFGYPPLESWLDRTHGLDLMPHRPTVALVAVVLHVPVIAGMVGALVVLDERDDGALRVIGVSPLGMRRHLIGRLAAVTVATAIGLAVAAPLSGLVPASAWAAVALAVPLGPVFTVAILAAARSRVQGVTSAKVLGLPAYLPVAAGWLGGAAMWLLAPLPGFWVVQAWDGPRPAWLAGGAAVSLLWFGVLLPRVLRSVGTPT